MTASYYYKANNNYSGGNSNSDKNNNSNTADVSGRISPRTRTAMNNDRKIMRDNNNNNNNDNDGYYFDNRQEENENENRNNWKDDKGKGSSNGWKRVSLFLGFLLVWSLSLQLGIFGGSSSSQQSATTATTNQFDDKKNVFSSPSSRRLEQQQGSLSSSTNSNSNSVFQSLETLHQHPLAQRQAPPGQLADRTGPSLPSNIMGGASVQMMHNSHKSGPPKGIMQQQQQQERHLVGFSDVFPNINDEDVLDTDAPLMDESSTEDGNIFALSSGGVNGNEDVLDTSAPLMNESSMEDVDANTSMEGRLRASLLENYDKNAFPWEWAWEQNYDPDFDQEGDGQLNDNDDTPFADNGNGTTTSTNKTDKSDQLREGLPVEFGLNFHKVHALNVAESTADLVVWVRLKWTDPRLMWDPAEFGGRKVTWFYLTDGMGGGEVSEIWTPDIYLWNQEEPMTNTLANTYATVSSDGSVFWSRPGRIKSTCKYEGLKHFPFDKLGCKLEFGSWAHSGLYLRLVKLAGTGYSIGGSNTAGGSYVEFYLNGNDVAVEEIIYPPYPSSPEEDWPVLIYTVKFDRASKPYTRGVVLINILLNFAAFACFWIPPDVGERMGLAITCVLSGIAGEIVVAGLLPICEELSWYNRFSLGSTTFALLVVFESTVVIFFHFYTGNDLTPSYIKYIKRKNKERQIRRIDGKARKEWEREENRIEYDDGAAGGVTTVALPDDDVPLRGISGNGSTKCSFNSNSSKSDDNNDDRASGELSRHVSKKRKAWSRDRSAAARMSDAGNFKTEKQATNNEYWQNLSGYIDEGARVFVPLLYCAFLAYIFKDRQIGR